MTLYMTSLNLLLNTSKESKNLNSLRRQTRDVGGSRVGRTQDVWDSLGPRASSGGTCPLIRKHGPILWVSSWQKHGFCFLFAS